METKDHYLSAKKSIQKKILNDVKSSKKRKRKNYLLLIESLIADQIEEGVDEELSELNPNEPDGAIIWECISRAMEEAKVPYSEWDKIRKYVEKSMHDEGWKFILA